MFKRKKKSEVSTENIKESKPSLLIKYPKPKILLVDLEDTIETSLLEKGFNVVSGSFGNPYKVSKSDSFQPIICKGNLPNCSEQEVVIINLEQPETLDKPKGEKDTSDGENDWWASCCDGVIDPRPKIMVICRKYFDRILEHGGLFVIFIEERVKQKLKFGHIYNHVLVGDNINFDNWSFLTVLDESHVNVKHDFGEEVSIIDKNIIAETLEKYLADLAFSCTLSKNYQIYDKHWMPLAKNKYGQTVSAAIIREFNEENLTFVLLLPQIKSKKEIICDLIENVLPNLTPHLFPYNAVDAWIHQREYELPQILELKNEIQKLKAENEEKINIIEEKIKKTEGENEYWYDLIKGTGRPLVQAVKKSLEILGFEKVIDVDEELKGNEEDRSLREDLRIEDKSPILVVDVKGIIDKPSDPEAMQSHKHATIRMKEWKKTDVNSLTINAMYKFSKTRFLTQKQGRFFRL